MFDGKVSYGELPRMLNIFEPLPHSNSTSIPWNKNKTFSIHELKCLQNVTELYFDHCITVGVCMRVRAKSIK